MLPAEGAAAAGEASTQPRRVGRHTASNVGMGMRLQGEHGRVAGGNGEPEGWGPQLSGRGGVRQAYEIASGRQKTGKPSFPCCLAGEQEAGQ